MLVPCAAITVPAVVRNIHQDLGTVQRPLANLVGENRFVTDEHSEAFATGIKRRMRSAMLELAHLFGQSTGKGEEPRKGQVLPKGDQMHFVVAASPGSFRSDQRRGVENLREPSAAVHGGIDSDRSGNYPLVGLPGQGAERISKEGIVGVERRRRLGPNDQIVGLSLFLRRTQTDLAQIAQRV